MKAIARITILTVVAFFLASVHASAQGPAGAGAAAAAGGGSSSSHSLNPLKWIGKKDAKPTGDAPVANDELDKRLETKLRAMQVLGEQMTLRDACAKFLLRMDCLAALHASHDLDLNFGCVKSNVTGVRVGGDTSSCRVPKGDKPLSLAKTIKLLKPDVNAREAAKGAEIIAKQELTEAGG